MNLPVGDIVSKDINMREIDNRKLIEGFYDKSFSGYLVFSLDGYDGIEEGVLLFKDGFLTAAFYEFDLHDITLFGDSAIPHVFNAIMAPGIVGDIVALTNQQVDLITAFNDKAKLKKPIGRKDFKWLIPKAYSSELSAGVLNQFTKKEEPKKDILRKFGLSGLT